LPPGRYQVTISGLRIHPITTKVSVRDGQQTQLILWVRNARQAAAIEDAGGITGKALLYTVAAGGDAAVWIAVEGRSSRSASTETTVNVAKTKDQPHPGSASTYRKPKP